MEANHWNNGGGDAAAVNAAAGIAVIVAPSSRLRLGRQCLSWSKVPVSPKSAFVPPPRSGAASVVVGGRLYVFGGYGGGMCEQLP
jgi:Kelch motif